jgi:hypothetical protein
MPEPILRAVPEEFLDKRRKWYRQSVAFSWLHLTLGGTAVVLGIIIAANSKSRFIDDTWALLCASSAAFLTFINTVVKPDARGTGYEFAARELEIAIGKFQTDETLPLKYLGDAQERALLTLNGLKPN